MFQTSAALKSPKISKVHPKKKLQPIIDEHFPIFHAVPIYGIIYPYINRYDSYELWGRIKVYKFCFIENLSNL